MIVGISRARGSDKYRNYEQWLRRGGDEELQIIDLSASTDLLSDLLRIDGLLLSGGPDIDPERYGNSEARTMCDDIDVERDAIEFQMLDVALDRQIPVLGICRGIQLINVHQGGTLIPHLPDRLDGSQSHYKTSDGDDRWHAVEVRSGSLLYKSVGALEGNVNSNHHQAVDALGSGLVASAESDDGVVEAIERADSMGKSYLLGVEWHPERMAEDNAFSTGIRDSFLFEVRSAVIFKRNPRTPTKGGDSPEERNGSGTE